MFVCLFVCVGVEASPYLSVDDLVSAQRARLPETFAANFAHERPRAGVHGHVARQVVVRVKHLKQKIMIIILLLLEILQLQ